MLTVWNLEHGQSLQVRLILLSQEETGVTIHIDVVQVIMEIIIMMNGLTGLEQ